MSLLSQKSDFNYASAEHLQKATYYCSVVHCAYYSCLQLMKHILLNNVGKTSEQIREESSKDPLGNGFHAYMISSTAKFLFPENKKQAVMFVTEMHSLRKLRSKADYEEVNIDVKMGKSSIELSQKINKILKNAL